MVFTATATHGLAPQTRRVLDLALTRASNGEIADELNISPNTVRVHLGRLYGRFRVKGREQLRALLRAS
jgi:DNA-binding CsgD family transcriptional regulator